MTEELKIQKRTPTGDWDFVEGQAAAPFTAADQTALLAELDRMRGLVQAQQEAQRPGQPG